MIALTLYALAWALWRRWLGGWIGVPKGWGRVPHVLVMIALCAPAGMTVWWYWPVAAALSATFWLPGHRYDNFKALMLRYGPIGLPWHFARLHWPPHWTVRTGKTWLIDGWSAAGELGAGAVYGVFLLFFI